ncbi:hypothetical protein [Aeromicrobium sp.]
MNSSRPRASRRSTSLRAVCLGIAAIALAACSNVHPGSAAVVDGESISMGKADETATAYCELALAVASQQGNKAVGTSETRRQAVADLIAFTVAQRVAKERDLQIDPAGYTLTDEQKTQIDKTFPDADLEEITAAIERSRHTYAVVVALGEEATGKKLSEANTKEIEAAGQAEIVQVYKSTDISIDPRFGLDDLAQQVANSGSLSIAEVPDTAVDPAKLPASQRCT